MTKGSVWGIDEAWAVSPSVRLRPYFDADRRHYTMRAWIDPAWTDALGIAPGGRRVVRRHQVTDAGSTGVPTPLRAAPFDRGPSVATVTNPDPREPSRPRRAARLGHRHLSPARPGLPHLQRDRVERRSGHHGRRGVPRPRRTDDGRLSVLPRRRRAGRASSDRTDRVPPEHQHWHFRQFTEYSILDADSGQIAISGKESWCLANTDAIDLSVPNANWAGYGSDVFTMCGGGPGALWIREVLDVGWGDTYSQYIAGQAFDITDLPNGDYYIRVRGEPARVDVRDHHATTTCRIGSCKLRARPGDRRVVVPPWHGIDTEGGCYFCG